MDTELTLKQIAAPRWLEALNTTVLISALGYFVDIYDLVLFGIVRISSLKGIGIPDSSLLDVGVSLINTQMIGMLLGGIFWGVLGDRKGRVSVLFGSILLYSVSNIMNAFTSSIEGYGVWRFLAGVGLAGELGAAITLVSEILDPRLRGYGTAFVAGMGILGGVVAGLVGDLFSWRFAYFLGGILGFFLLIARFSIRESGLFKKAEGKSFRRGDLRLLITSKARLKKYIQCTLLGVPIWYVIGILMTFSPELTQALGVKGSVTAGKSILFCYLGLSIGDIGSGYLSQIFETRKKVVLAFLALTTALVGCYFFLPALTNVGFYFLSFSLGLATGYWAIFVTVAAEQFGTNLRATVATTVPNFVRGSVVILTSSFQSLQRPLGLVQSALWVGLATLILAGFSLKGLQETYGKDLDFLEE